MIVLGWFVLLILSVWFWFVTLAGSYVSLGFSGKLDFTVVVPLVAAVFFSWLAYDNWPFVLAMKVVS